MKKKYIAIISGVVVVAIVLVVVLLRGGGVANNNTEPNGNGNGNSNSQRPPDTENWISPGKFYVEGYEPGSSVECLLEVHNGNSFATNFSVDYRFPDGPLEGYSKAPSEARDWLWISDRRPTLDAYETLTVTLRLGMPTSAGNLTEEKWEFWIGVIDQSQEGIVQVELASRVLVTMK